MLLNSVYNHIVLPPCLPGGEDRDLKEIETDLMTKLVKACRTLRDILGGEHYVELDAIRRSLETAKLLNARQKVNKDPLFSELSGLRQNETLILHVREQNAGVLIARQQNPVRTEDFVIEVFEAAALSENVLASDRALEWEFPGQSVLIPSSDFSATFKESFSTFLEQASTESIKHFAARARKAGVSTFECRDTTDPALVSHMLMALLEVHGRPISPPKLQKRIRDDVCWNDGAINPWRRSPLWLVLRVGAQRQLVNLYGHETGRVCYKILMCVVHSQLLLDIVQAECSPELVSLLKTKLCRRLAKLEISRQTKPSARHSSHGQILDACQAGFHKAIQDADEYIRVQWEQFKRRQLRPVPSLPRRARPADCYLTLPNSQGYVRNVLDGYSQRLESHQGSTSVDLSSAGTHAYHQFANLYTRLSDLERKAEGMENISTLDSGQSERFKKVAAQIKHYLHKVIQTGAYDSNPEQKGIMILTIMEVWTSLDQYAIRCYPLLKEFSPVFSYDILNCLQLPLFKDMDRLQNVQDYLRKRHIACGGTVLSIFDDPRKGCFGERFVNESTDSDRFLDIQRRIERAASAARVKKEDEWRKLSADHETLSKEAAESACLYTEDSLGHRVHDDRRCHKCFLERKANRIRISAHEHPLPENKYQLRTVIFELGCPETFAVYRQVTWQILAALGIENQLQLTAPRIVLGDYSPLQPYNDSDVRSISLASTTKPFVMTHYASIRFPVSFSEVCMPNGLKLAYYDEATNLWPGRQSERPTFWHHCRLVLPRTSPFASLDGSSNFTMRVNEPTSYEIIASQTRCPQNSNIHEYMAFQGVLSGINRRWPSMLAELGSSSLNFSNYQAGPECLSVEEDRDTSFNFDQNVVAMDHPQYGQDRRLRAIHGFFQEDLFCERFLQLLEQRANAVASNWRETSCMSMLISLGLRICSLVRSSNRKFYEKSHTTLERLRNIAFGWITELRTELQKASDAKSHRRCSMYLLSASLLCKQTFSTFCETRQQLSSADLKCFLECSAVLQNNLIDDPRSLQQALRFALIRDLKMTHHMKGLIRSSVEDNPQALTGAIEMIWPQPEGSNQRAYSQPQLPSSPDDWWIETSIDVSTQTSKQTLHFHMLQGHLLVNGQPPGKLPPKYMESTDVRRLFGDQSFQTYPSRMPGMIFMLSVPFQGHQIHLGLRDDDIIIRACIGNSILELLPRNIFGNYQSFDIPGSLINGYDHWLDLRSGIIDIRPSTETWKRKLSHWRLNFYTRKANRRASLLVNPHCALFKVISRTFNYFERSHQLELYQPGGALCLLIRRLDLSFWVNEKGLLESRELQQEIDPNQDAGTWYGLYSKLILRDPRNTRKRSILVPFGSGSVMKERSRIHMAIKMPVEMQGNGAYGRYAINDILGRLDCVAEPKLLYLKVLLHAYTSFPVPDPLTARTGTEEALQFLRSEVCLPWTPISQAGYEVLTQIAQLSPRREYYPQGLKNMQKTHWDPSMTITVQHDAFWPVVQAITTKSAQLASFALTNIVLPPLISRPPEAHLLNRGLARRSVFERPSPKRSYENARDQIYTPRDHRNREEYRQKIARLKSVVETLRQRPSRLASAIDLAGILQNWSKIGGFDQTFNAVLLSDQLAADVALKWGGLVRRFRDSGIQDIHPLMFLTSTLAFCDDVNIDVLRTLVAFALLEDLKSIPLLPGDAFVEFRHNQIPRVNDIMQLIEPYNLPYCGDELQEVPYLNAKQQKRLRIRENHWNQSAEDDCKTFAQFLLSQWPCEEPSIGEFDRNVKIDIERALDNLKPQWFRMFHNLEFSNWIDQVQDALDRHRGDPPSLSVSFEIRENHILKGQAPKFNVPTLAQLLTSHMTTSSPPNQALLQPTSSHSQDKLKENKPLSATRVPLARTKAGTSPVSPEIQKLEDIIRHFSKSTSLVRQSYSQDLLQSIQALEKVERTKKPNFPLVEAHRLVSQVAQADSNVRKCHSRICQAVEASEHPAMWLKAGGLWPCTSVSAILENLRSIRGSALGEGVKECLVDYALAITALQQSLRMHDASSRNRPDKVSEELLNTGHSNWRPDNYPDWLLLEIEADILIRPDQVDVALATVSPVSGQNSVLQMNMGQGKTSVIMPMVATLLADTKKLVRVCVPRALLLQTAQLLQSRLGGLIGRPTGHIPFSRKTPTTQANIIMYADLHKELLRSAGIMIALPEHIMSFMLSGRQRLSDSLIPEATTMINVQEWLQKHCRDILDECDFTLSARTQLIYPSGSQRTVDGSPHRWETAQALLRLVKDHLWNLRNEFPYSIEVVEKESSGFPFIYILRRDVEEALLTRLVEDICSGQMATLPIAEWSETHKSAVKTFISSARVPPDLLDQVGSFWQGQPAAKKVMYLLRGLLVHRILLLTLKKRWNVQYGLHPNRDPVAVPFHAKGMPSDQAEWGHPDVAILFTCLSFYYGGLNSNQLRQCLETITKSDDPASQYDRLTIDSSSLPDSLKEWNAINVDDEAQFLEVWHHMRSNMTLIDYFLNNFVFPEHAKQFALKIQASGWDIPIIPPGKLTGPASRTTGFSGTNDNRSMLPLTIKQNDLPRLSHTNAEVLTYLLQPRSQSYQVAQDEYGRFSEFRLLQKISRMDIRILIDAGAQILEMDNKSLSKRWLSTSIEAPAALYFNTDNKAIILYRNGREVPFLASPFVDNLDEVLVYLDEAHTRGTDLKFPKFAKGALTLGLGITKDSLVQAAMRLRQLGTSQSVVFFASREVQQSIKDHRPKPYGAHVDSSDVIYWLLAQTCDTIEQLQPLFYSQGADYCRRTQAELDNPEFLTNIIDRQEYLNVIQQAEQQSLVQLYEPKQSSSTSAFPENPSPRISTIIKELKSRRKGFQDTGNAVHSSALQEVEQEREVAVQQESIREVQKPVHYTPLKFAGLHRDILSFVKNGSFPAGSQAYEQVFQALQKTGVGLKHEINAKAVNSRFYVSKEFLKTVNLGYGRRNDNFLRQVNWILLNTTTEAALIVNPEEAKLLIPIVRNAESPKTHLLTYATPVTRKMLHFNRLQFFAIPDLPSDWTAPEWLLIELGIFAGRLYFEESEYDGLCRYLGIQRRETGNGASSNIASEDKGDIFAVGEQHLSTTQRETSSFTAKPLAFLKQWLAVRRKGQEFANTPMGYVCHGKRLTKDHPFFERARERPDSSESSTQAGAVHQSERYQGKELEDAGDDDDYDEDFDENEIGDIKDDGDDEFYEALEDQNESHGGDYDVEDQ
ncbi:hypothetical protein EV356DRAFT_570800 [Viridothelium virens]|uniref:ubiquitinyl hydrolase 1 n=1 Tax=Viridothelium virens TaxID=1048519 RepID=A0A6A6GW76_VIRVR|nr:hypothetical protein EV356DRAFT_570800 [Viridothelium virens]